MSKELQAFFEKITNDNALQEQLYLTKEISDVVVIAHKLGFKVTASEILWAQAARVLTLPLEELEDLAAGKRAKSGAQWGRAGKGYLERVGFWLLEYEKWGCVFLEPQLAEFIAKAKQDKELLKRILAAKVANEVAALLAASGFKISGTALVCNLAKQLLSLNEEQAEKVAKGAGNLVA